MAIDVSKQLTLSAELTDEMIAEAEALVGQTLRIEQWNHEATLDTIRHYEHGIGDDNPLYCDEDYALAGPYGTITAPPIFLFTFYSGALGLGMPGVQPYGAGFKFRFHEVLRRGDRVRADATIGPIKVLSGRHAKRMVLQTTQTRYVRVSDGVLVGDGIGRTMRIPRNSVAGGLSYTKRDPYVYSEDELEDIRQQAIGEVRRGSETRYWDDVEVGETIPHVVKGPIDLSGQIAYYSGLMGNPRTKGVDLQWKFITWAREAPERLPNNYDPSFFGEIKAFTAGHVEAGVAQQVGMPGADNNGAQTTAWLAHPVMNWMGDHGLMTELESKLTRPAIFSDTLWCRGTVVEKSTPGIVELSLTAVNQIDTQIAEGRATVRLRQRDEN